MGYEVNPQRPKFLKSHHQLFHASGEPVESPDNNNVEGPASSVSHESIEAWSSFLGAADTIRIDAMQVPAALCNQLTQWTFLNFWILVKS